MKKSIKLFCLITFAILYSGCSPEFEKEWDLKYGIAVVLRYPDPGSPFELKSAEYNLYDEKAQVLLSEEWFSYINFHVDAWDLVRTHKGDKMNYFNLSTKKLILSKDFYHMGAFEQLGAFGKLVVVENECNAGGKNINLYSLEKGEYLFDKFVEEIDFGYSFDYVKERGWIIVQDKGFKNVFDLKGKKYLLPEWYRNVELVDKLYLEGKVKITQEKKEIKKEIIDLN